MAKQNAVVRAVKTVAKHVNVKAAGRKVTEILADELDPAPKKTTDPKGGK